jgi:hypothetical protein
MIKENDDVVEDQILTPEEFVEAVKQYEETVESETDAEETVVSTEPVPLERDVAETIRLLVAKEAFEKGLKNRSFSGRNPELGPMIKCARCGLRHRDNVKHDPIKYKEGTTQSEHGRPAANPAGWRAKPGKMYWIKELKKFLTVTR